MKTFVSGVSSEFKSSRKLASDDLLMGDIQPVVQDYFAPQPSTTVEQLLRDKIEPCDAVICLIGFAFGAHPNDRPDRSYTQMEFDIACELGKPIFRFFATEDFEPDELAKDSDAQRDLQEKYRADVRDTDELYYDFSNKHELQKLVEQAIPEILALSPQYKPTQVSISHLPQPGRYFVGRENELKLLSDAWLDPKKNIVELVAFGGVGKSALVAHWLKEMKSDGWRGAARVFGHSFYSQGSRDDAQASADSFLDQALRFFGDPDPTEGSPWDKGERLARLVCEQPTLLVLDGVEPLQSPGRLDDAGQVRDPGLQALVVELAGNMNGLVVISTRARVQDIVGWEGTSVLSHELDHLSVEAGSSLLREIGVQGTDDEIAAAVREVDGHALSVTLVGKYVVFAASGHVQDRFEIGLPRVDIVSADDAVDPAIAVTPDVDKIGRELSPQAGKRRRNSEHTSKTFSRIMQRYEVWLSGLKDADGNVDESGRLALEIVRLTGLFDRPITAGEFAALVGRISNPSSTAPQERRIGNPSYAIPGLTDLASGASEGEVNLAIGRLVEYGLITKVTGSRIRLSVRAWPEQAASEVVLDAHPLVREFFAKTLTQPGTGATGSGRADSATTRDEQSTGRASGTPRGAEGEPTREPDESRDSPSGARGVSASVREAHRRLCEHLKQAAPERPDNLNDMMPLYHAVAHGCKAGLHDHVLEGIYWARIQHEDEFFACRKLGAFGSDILALSNFFDRLWTKPVTQLDNKQRRELFNLVGFGLRALGRLPETSQPLSATVQSAIDDQIWRSGAIAASNLSELSLTLGDVSSAVRQGEQSVELADHSGDAFDRMDHRTTLAAALFCAGVTRWQGDQELPLGALASGLSDASVSGQARAAGEPVSRGASATGQARNPAADASRLTALAAFREAEAMQQERQPQYPLLYSVPGYRYCELLLADVRGVRFQLARSRPDQAQRRSSNEEGGNPTRQRGMKSSEDPAFKSLADASGYLDQPGASALPLTEENVAEDAPAALRSVRPTGEDRKLEAYATAAPKLQSEIESIRNRAETALQIVLAGSQNLLDQGLNHLTLGRTWQLSALLECVDWSPLSLSQYDELSDQDSSNHGAEHEIQNGDVSPHSQAEHHLTQSVTLLRQAGQQDHLPRGLLHRAALWREMLTLAPSPNLSPQGERDFVALAERDLDEAETIANRGSMLIWQIESAVERAELYRAKYQITNDKSQLELAREKLDEAKQLVKKTERPYEPHVPDWEDWNAPEYVGVFKKGDIVGYHCRNADIERLEEELRRL